MKRHTSYLDRFVAFSVMDNLYPDVKIDLGPQITITPANPNHGLQLGDILEIGVQRKNMMGTLDGGKWEVTEADLK